MAKDDDKKSKDAQSKDVQSSAQPDPPPKQKWKQLMSFQKKVEDNDWNALSIFFFIVAVAVIIAGVAAIVMTAVAAASEIAIDQSQNKGRLAGLITLCVEAIVVVVMTIFAMVGMSNKQYKRLNISATVIVIVAIIQALSCGVAVHMTDKEVVNFENSLSASFQQCLIGDQPSRDKWDRYQSTMHCCGYYGPEDFRDSYSPVKVPPQVPASCCPGVNDTNSKQYCINNQTYYKQGCKQLLEEATVGLGHAVCQSTIAICVLEAILAAFSWIIYAKQKKAAKKDLETAVDAAVASN